MEEELAPGTPFWMSCAAGSIAGIVEHTVVFPLDNIKTHMQAITKAQGPLTSNNTMRKALKSIITHQTAIQDELGSISMRSTAKPQSFRHLWRGVMSVVAGAGPAHAVYFGTYEWSKGILFGNKKNQEINPSNSPIRTAMCGAFATSMSDAIMTPFDVIKQRMQLSLHGNTIPAVARSIWSREGGLLAFYRSYPTTLFLNVPFQSVQFPTYEFFRSVLSEKIHEGSPLSHMIAGAISGGAAAAATTPIDVIKTVIQTTPLKPSNGSSSVRIFKDAITDSCRTIMTEYGVFGFWRGVAPRVLAAMPSTAVCWTTYEYFKWALRSCIPSADEADGRTH